MRFGPKNFTHNIGAQEIVKRIPHLTGYLAAIFMIFGELQPAHAVNPTEMLGNDLLEKRARHISKDIRCVVCQNQSIDDSDAP